MLSLVLPDPDQVRVWLEQAGIKHYICEHCHGLHLSRVQDRDAVVDCRLFVEQEALLLTTELELRPSASFAALAEAPRFNMQWPALKVFPDIQDDTLPRLVACDLLHGRRGITFEQFADFVQATVEATLELQNECQRLGWLSWPEDDEPGAPPESGPVESLH